MAFKNILLVRPDNLGDVVLALPLAGIIKQHFPAARISFLGTGYTRALVQKSKFVDAFYDWTAMGDTSDERLQATGADTIIHVYPDWKIARAAHAANIPVRIGIANRWFNLLHCNRLVWLRRRNSNLHETLLNVKLLKPLGIPSDMELLEIPQYYGWQKSPAEQTSGKRQIIFHPKSHGNGCEYPLTGYLRLAKQLDAQQFRIHITGSRAEGMQIKQECPSLFELPHVVDVTGRYQLEELIALIETADCLVASGTGPVHIAAAAGTFTVGLYPPVRPIHPARWGPVGENVITLCKGDINADKKTMQEQIKAIRSEDIYRAIVGGLGRTD